MADINVRLINGESLVVHCPSDQQINVKQIRELLAQQKPNLASCQLFHNGSIVKGSLSIASLNLSPGEFLVALERKPKEGPAASISNRNHRLDNNSKNDPSIERNGGLNTSQEEHVSPKSFDEAPYSLLPGYISRPQASPQKPNQQRSIGVERFSRTALEQVPQIEEEVGGGGFIASTSTADINNPRQQPKSLLQLLENRQQQQPKQSGVRQPDGGEILQKQTQTPTANTPPPAVSLDTQPNASNITTPLNLDQIPANAIATLPLPTTALLLESHFRNLCTFYEFFQRHHLQCTFTSIQQSMINAGVTPHLTLEILELMARLCPSVLHVTRHVSAAEQPENRTDDWREMGEDQTHSNSVEPINGVVVIDGGSGGNGYLAETGNVGATSGAEDVVISLVDPWEAKYEEGGSPPMIFLEEMHSAEIQQLIPPQLQQEGAIATAAGTVLDAGDLTNANNTNTTNARKRKKLSSNKPRRMAWQFRKSIINALRLLQQDYFGNNVPVAAVVSSVKDSQELEKQQQSRKKRAANTRRSKAGKEKQAQRAAAAAAAEEEELVPEAAAEIISLLDDEEEEEERITIDPLVSPAQHQSTSKSSVLYELLIQGKWHLQFPLENIVTLAALKESAEKIYLFQQQQEGVAINGGPSNPGNNTVLEVDALAVARNALQQEQQQRQKQQEPKKPISKRPRPAAPPQLLKKHAPCTDTTHLSAPDFLKHLKSRSGYQDQIVHVENLPARPATFADLVPVPPFQVVRALEQRYVTRLYSHQTEAISHLRAGRHTVIATSTASGKSMCYALPIFEALVANPASCAVLIFPTKALAQDQKKNLQDMAIAAFGVDAAPAVEIYDGDTPMDERASIRDRAQLILTNPDMVHLSILPVHSQFSRILSNLKYVVIDEAHSYKGVFGCHTALVLRRLRRVCSRLYNSNPTFAVTTATVANPAQHACTLLGVSEVVVVEKDGSPHGSKEFVLWNPPLKHPELAKAKAAAAAGKAMAAVASGGAAAASNEGNINSMPSTSKIGSKLVTRRALQESGRAAVRAARQERHAGIMLGGPERGIEEKDWAAAVGAGQRDPVVKAKVLSSSPEKNVLKKAATTATASLALPATAAAAAMDAEPQQQQQHALQQKLTARQRVLISQANAAISLASGPYTNTSSLHQYNGSGGGGGGGAGNYNSSNSNNGNGTFGQRRVIKIGPVINSNATTNTTVPKTTATTDDNNQEEDKLEPLPTSLSSKQSASKISTSAPARFGSAGVDMTSARTSPIVEMASLLAECVQHGLRTIAFCKTRKLSELVIAYVREILAVTAPELQTKVAVYRAGYSAAERRQIEAALFSGALVGVAATNALELGVDIGGLDATLHLGFPGSIASLWQQAGRAGRSQQPSISIYVGWDGPLDQYFFTNPAKLFSRPIEAAMVDVSNPAALQAHAACAAYEVSLDPELDSTHYFGPTFSTVVAVLQNKGILGRNFLYTGSHKNPASAITLRAIDPGKFSIIDETASNGAGKVLEEVEETKVFYQVHDGSTYFFQGRTYLCRKLDLDAKVALVRPVDVKYYTKSVDFTAVQVIGGGESAFPVLVARQPGVSLQFDGGARAAFENQHSQPSHATTSTLYSSNPQNPSPLLPTSARASAATVTTRWLGFVRIWRGTGEVFDSVDLFLPDVQYETEAAYLRLPPTARRRVEAARLPFRDGVHAAAHAVLNALPLFLMANPEDVGTECDNPYDTRYKPERILIYDKHPGGGIGLAKAACSRFTELLQRALAIITNCSCTLPAGCPGCIQHTACGEYNAVLHKEAGRLVLEAALEAEAEKYGLDKTALGLAVEQSQRAVET